LFDSSRTHTFVNPPQYLAEAEELRAEIAELQKVALKVNREELLFGYKPTPFAQLQAHAEEIEP